MVGMGSIQSEHDRQLRQLADQKRRQVAVYIGMGLLAVAAVAVALYAIMTT